VVKEYAAIRLAVHTHPLRTGYLCPGKVGTNFGSSMPFCSPVRIPFGTDKQTDRRAKPVMRPIRMAA